MIKVEELRVLVSLVVGHGADSEVFSLMSCIKFAKVVGSDNTPLESAFYIFGK